MSAGRSDTFRDRLDQYQRRQKLTIWVAAALGGMVVIIGSDTVNDMIKDVPQVLLSLILTLVPITGLAIGLTRVKFEWRETRLRRLIEANDVKLDSAIPANEEFEWPQDAENWWTVSLLGVLFIGILFLVAIWWNVVKQL
ncbi:MAG: hypothetical protein FJ147_10590 [Deltaproteobacteria bacterium]|nr:hypothetical protein [Deltaproteobacteria bacterium]